MSDLAALTHVLTWFDQFDHSPVPHQVWLEIQLALAEGFTNAVRHAHVGLPSETPIEIEVILDAQAITLKIWDYGTGFDFNRCLEQQTQEMEHAERGRGLDIIRKVADRLSYIQFDQRNCLLIVRHYGELQ